MNNNYKTKVRAISAPWHGAVQFLISGISSFATPDEGIGYVTQMIFEKKTPGEIVESSMTLTLEDAQVLMDDLWNCGLRPTEGTGSAGALAGVTKHNLYYWRNRIKKKKKKK